jgi:hypothetical protein
MGIDCSAGESWLDGTSMDVAIRISRRGHRWHCLSWTGLLSTW